MNTELKTEVESLIVEVDRTHRYSMGGIYGLYNRVFSKNEVPQSCASCLIRKVRELRKWLEDEKAKENNLDNKVGDYEKALTGKPGRRPRKTKE